MSKLGVAVTVSFLLGLFIGSSIMLVRLPQPAHLRVHVDPVTDTNIVWITTDVQTIEIINRMPGINGKAVQLFGFTYSISLDPRYDQNQTLSSILELNSHE